MTQLCFDFADGDEGLLAEQIRHSAEQGLALSAIAKQLRVARATAFAIARRYDIAYKHKHKPAETIAKAIALVRDQGLTVRQAAKAVGMSKTAAHRFVLKERQKAVDAAGKIRFEHASPAIAKRRGWRCPKCRRQLTTWPCVACLAEESR